MLCCICCPWGQGRARARAHMAGAPPCTASGAAMALLWSPLPSYKTPSTSTGDPYPLLALLPSTPFGGSGSDPHYRASPLPCPALPCPALPCPAPPPPCPALPCPAPLRPAPPRPALPCPALPCPALPCSALPCPALPRPAPAFHNQDLDEDSLSCLASQHRSNSAHLSTT